MTTIFFGRFMLEVKAKYIEQYSKLYIPGSWPSLKTHLTYVIVLSSLFCSLYTEALHLKPDDFKSAFNRGYAYDRLGLLEEAVADYSHALTIEPKSALALFNRGLVEAVSDELMLLLRYPLWEALWSFFASAEVGKPKTIYSYLDKCNRNPVQECELS